MIGTGVFTSLGFQVVGLKSGFALLFLWFLGGVSALFGAFVYAELGAAMPRSGGEYNFLSRIYHPALGFLSGWVSFIIGFAAPVAAASIAFGSYFLTPIQSYFDLANGVDIIDGIDNAKLIAALVIISFTVLHASDKRIGALFQNVLTTFKILVIVVLIIIGFVYGGSGDVKFELNVEAWRELTSPAFFISLFFVSYSYAGWNAAAYIAGEVNNPQRNIPLSLIIGTSLVIGLYVLLNFVFLYSIPLDKMVGEIEIGYLFGSSILGPGAANIMGVIIAFILLSTISSMILTGPRVTQVMGEDFSLFKWLGDKTNKDIPAKAIMIQGIISIIYLATATFEQMIIYIAFTLNLSTLLVVIGVLVSRVKQKNLARPFITPGYPFVPILFIVLNTWILGYGLIYKPYESMAGVAITLIGLVIYYIDKWRNFS